MGWLGRLRYRLTGAWVSRFRRYDAADFAAALTKLGVRQGDVLMVHAALPAHSGYTGTPAQMLAALKAAVGEQGLLVMPSMTYSDSTRAFLQRQEPVHLKRSASRMGLLTEVFRRGKEVRRSANPAHPLLAWGARADAFVEGHERVDRSFGDASPFARLLDEGGRVLCIGASLEAVTFTHFLEDRQRDRIPFALYDDEPLPGTVVLPDGAQLAVMTRVLSDESRRRRDESRFWRLALGQGVVREVGVGNTRLRLMDCRALTALFDAEFEAGRHWF